MKPWERYPAQGGPWTRYQSTEQEQEQTAPPEPAPEPRTLSEKVWRGLAAGGRLLAETPALTVAGGADLLSKGANLALSATPTDYRLPENRAQTVQEGFNRMGFPQPENKAEEYAQRVGRGVVGAAFGPAAGRTLSASPNPVTAGVGRVLTDVPGIQAGGAASGSTAGFVAQELGAGPTGQMAAEMAGGALVPAGAMAATRTAAGAGRTVAGLKDAFTETGQRKIVGNILEDQAINAQRSGQRLAEEQAFGPGISEKTTGEITRDPGLLTLERGMRNIDSTGRFAQQSSRANTARQKILDVLGGEDVAAAKTTRNVATGAQREAAFEGATGVKVQPVLDRIDTILASPEGARKVVRNALETYRKEIDGITDPKVLYEIRKDLNDAMQGKFSSGDRSDFKLAKSQLKAVKDAIDIQIEQVAPGFRKYLSDYAALSADIERRGIIQNIQDRARLAVSDPESGRDILSHARFKSMVRAERQNGTLTDEQLTVLEAIADDLDSGQAINAATVRPTGSDTAKNLTVAHVLGRAIGGKTDSAVINTLAKPFQWVTTFPEERVQALLVDAMLDPKLARMLLAEARPDQVNRTAIALRTALATGSVGSILGAQPEPRTGTGQQ